MKANEVKKILRVTQKTLNSYIQNGKLHPTILSKTRYEYDEDEVYALIGKKKPLQRFDVTYARVSQRKQKEDLDRQNERLYNFAINNGFSIHEQLSDIKSGMDFLNRKNFQKLISLVFEHKIKTVIIENKDRLARFGFDLLKDIFKRNGTEIVVMSDVDNRSYEQELTDDLISIIHYYSMKSYSNRRKLNRIEKTLKEKEPEE